MGWTWRGVRTEIGSLLLVIPIVRSDLTKSGRQGEERSTPPYTNLPTGAPGEAAQSIQLNPYIIAFHSQKNVAPKCFDGM